MNIIPFRGLLPKLSLIPDHDRFFETVKEDFNQFYNLGYFLPQSHPVFYVFRIQSPGKQATGLICTTHVEDYIRGKVLKHEKTIHIKEQIQIELLLERQAAVKPVLLVHQKEAGIQRWLRNFALNHQPILQVEFPDQEKHLLWEVREEADLVEISRLFRENLSSAAIADGHHRVSSFATLWQQHTGPERDTFASVLSAYFPEDELSIAAFHRLVELPAAFDQQKFLQQLSKLGSLRPNRSPLLPVHKNQMSIILPSAWYDFKWNPEFLKMESPSQLILDVDLLDQHILGPLLAVTNIQADTRLHYIEDVDEPNQLADALNKLPPGIAFALHPIHPHDFLQIAHEGITLVPKATFFRPRLKNGLVVQSISVLQKNH